MPTYVSDKGRWFPAKEKIGLINYSKEAFEYEGKVINPGDPFIYEGPDRAAYKVLKEQGIDFLGVDFRHDPEFLQSVRNQGFETGERGVKKYLEHIGYDEKKIDEMFKDKINKTQAHEVPKAVLETPVNSGGRDFSGMTKGVKGGWSEIPAL